MRKSVALRLCFLIVLCISLTFVITACTAAEYEVTFVLGDGRENVTATVTSGNLDYIPDSIDEDYVFAGWFTDPELTRPYLSKNIYSNMTLYARFIKRGEKVVTFVYDNGTPDTTIVISGALTEPTDPVKAGYVFLGWVNAASGAKYEFGSEPVDQHTVLRASWRVAIGTVTLTVNPQNGDAVSTKALLYSAVPTPPEVPRREGYAFLGWYSDEACTKLFDFDKPLMRDTAIYAGWVIDSSSFGNAIATEMLKSTVKINVEHYNRGLLGGVSGGIASLGSGVIYAEYGGYYYVLTNNHVVERDTRYSYTDYYVYDAYGNSYTASVVAMDSAYDLAVVRFAVGEKALAVAPLATDDPSVGEMLASVGNPAGLINTVTYGVLSRYSVVDVTDGKGVDFAVGWHSAPLDHGSSGGAVFDGELKVVGINFASGTTSSGDAVGAFIQISRVREFLSNNSLIIP